MISVRIKPDSPAVIAIAIPIIGALALGVREIYEHFKVKLAKKPAATKVAGEYGFTEE